MRRDFTRSGRRDSLRGRDASVCKIFHQLVDFVVESLHLRLDGLKMRRDAVSLVAQHVQQHVAGKEHIREFVDGLELQRLRFLERFVEERHAFDGLCERISEFGFFVSHLFRSDF